MTRDDVPACVAIINHIVAVGGSTAREIPFDESSFAEHYLVKNEIANVVLSNGRIIGFQSAFRVEPDVFSIATFTDRTEPVRGAGSAVFEKTRIDCRALGATSIIATITEDNTGGLVFYSKIGFQPDSIRPEDHTRPNGTKVDRIVKRFAL